MVETIANSKRIVYHEGEIEHNEKLMQMMFAQTQRVPELKPITQLRFCGEELDCGHQCGGCKGESNHLPCLEPTCRPVDKLTKEDSCTVCGAGNLGAEPSVQLDCGHIFHANCIRNLLRHRWSTQRITFNFMKCPSCMSDIQGAECVPEIRQELTAMRCLKVRLGNMALKEMKADKMDNDPRLNDKMDRFYQKPLEFALHTSEFYECTRCHAPFFGGYVNCAAELAIDEYFEENDEMEEEQLMCQNCRLTDMGIREQFNCNKHGIRYLQFKCDFCCSIATFRCRANTYFCADCHKNPKRRDRYNCGGNKNKCPYSIAHHPTKKGVPIAGCIICTSQLQMSNPITFEDQRQVRLQKVLEATNEQLMTIVAAKRKARQDCESASRSARYRDNSRSSASSLSDKSQASVGNNVF